MAVIFHGMIVLAWVGLVAGGLRMIGTGFPVPGFTLAALGVITLALAVRRFIRVIGHWPPDLSADLPREQYDYIIWTALGLPLMLAGLAVVLAITGALGSR